MNNIQPVQELPSYPPLFFVRLAGFIRQRMIRLSRRFTHPNVIMLEYMQNLWVLGAVSVVNELGVADLLKTGPKTVSEIASLTACLDDPLYRIMRMLASEGIFRESDGRKFSNTKISESMCEEELKYFIRHTLNKMQFRIFGELMHSVKTGRRSSELFVDTGVFEHIGKSPELNELYNRAMTNTSKMQVAAILSSFSFKRFRHVVDVGGGQGFFLSAILAKYPDIRGTLFDLPHVAADRSKISMADQFDDRLAIETGSFFDRMPEGGDLYTMKNILHGWNDEDSVRILKSIRNVARPGTQVMVIEAVVDEENKPSWGKMSDIFMMAGLGGKERTRKEYEKIFSDSGFRLIRVKRSVSPLSLLIASPV